MLFYIPAYPIVVVERNHSSHVGGDWSDWYDCSGVAGSAGEDYLDWLLAQKQNYVEWMLLADRRRKDQKDHKDDEDRMGRMGCPKSVRLFNMRL